MYCGTPFDIIILTGNVYFSQRIGEYKTGFVKSVHKQTTFCENEQNLLRQKFEFDIFRMLRRVNPHHKRKNIF